MESPQYKRIVFVDQKQRPKEARFLTYKKYPFMRGLGMERWM